MNLFSLPPELLVTIVALLDVRDILSFCSTCRLAYEIVLHSTVLQYLIALRAAGMVNIDALSALSTRDRLEYLSRREDTWNKLDLKAERMVEIPVAHRHSHIHDLSAGLYVFGELNAAPHSIRTNNLRYVHLPTCKHDLQNLNTISSRQANWWKQVQLGVEALTIGVSLEYNDLLAVLTSVSLSDTGDMHIFQLHLRKFSTGQYHPVAQQPIIQLREHRIEGNQCIASIDIAGRHLLVLLTWLRAPNMPDEVYVYDWTTASLILHISSESSTYRAATFLSLETFILTNMRENAIEFVHLRKNMTEDTVQCRWIGKLALPNLRHGSSLISMNCRTDAIRSRAPGSTGSKPDTSSGPGPLGTSRRITIPVQCAPEKSIVQFRMYLQGGSAAPNVGHVSLFSFVARRGELLRILEPSATEGGSISPSEVVAIPWNEWGPNLTRWSGTDETDTAWMAGVAGQRQIYITGDTPRQIHVRDYNAATVSKELLRAGNKTRESRIRVLSEESVTAHRECFADDVHSSLPFVEIISEQAFDYDGVVMDESHVIGLTEDEENGSICRLDVFIMSPDDPEVCNCANVGAAESN